MRPKEAVADVGVDQIIKEQAKGIEGAEDKKAVQRDRRAQSLAAMGSVTREGSRYFVKTAAARGRQESYEVWRDENGRVHCSCAEFERLWADDPAFRCEHILAVKHSLAEQTLVCSAEDAEQTSARSEPEQFEVCSTTETVAEPKLEASNPDRTGQAQSAQIVPLAFANLLRTLRQP